MITKLFSSNFLDDYVKEHHEFPKRVHIRCSNPAELFICAEYLKQQGYWYVSCYYGRDTLEIRALRDPHESFLERTTNTLDKIDMSKNFALFFYDDPTDGSKGLSIGNGIRVETDCMLHAFLEHAFMQYKNWMQNTKNELQNQAKEFLPTKKGYNDFTKDCDNYLLPQYKSMVEEYNAGTYLYNRGVKEKDMETGLHTVVFRVPGATRGRVIIQNGIIDSIEFNEDTCFDPQYGCYHPKIKEKIPAKWIGQEWKVPYVGGYPK